MHSPEILNIEWRDTNYLFKDFNSTNMKRDFILSSTVPMV